MRLPWVVNKYFLLIAKECVSLLFNPMKPINVYVKCDRLLWVRRYSVELIKKTKKRKFIVKTMHTDMSEQTIHTNMTLKLNGVGRVLGTAARRMVLLAALAVAGVAQGGVSPNVVSTLMSAPTLGGSERQGMLPLRATDGEATVTITPDYMAETLTLSCSDNSYTTFFYTFDESDPQNSYDGEMAGLESGTLSVEGLADGTVVKVRAMKLVSDQPVWSDVAWVTIERYDAPEVTGNYSELSNHMFTVTDPNTGTTVRYAVGTVPVSTSTVSGATVSVTEYYTTYNFRVFGSLKFPSENVAKSTNRYNPPVIVDFVHYAAVTGSNPEIPVSGTLYSELGSHIYINSFYNEGDTLGVPNPDVATTYNHVLASGSAVPSSLTGDVFKMVAGPDPDPNATPVEMFPSPMVRVDNQYSGYFVIQRSETDAHHYLALDANNQLQHTITFDHGCLWMLDGLGHLYQHIGSTNYYVVSNGGVLGVNTATSGAKRWRIHPITHLLQDIDGNRLAYGNSGWRLAAPSSDPTASTEYAGAYVADKLHAEGGTYKEITNFALSGVKNAGGVTEWIALANGDAACSLSVTPQVTVTTYLLPAHDHYSFVDENADEPDFTYYERTRQSYASHKDLPYQRVAENGVNNSPNRDYLNYTWHLEYDETDGTGLSLGTAAIDNTGFANATNTIVRSGSVNAPHRARVWVDATYTITNAGTHGGATTEVRTATSEPLVVYAEQSATGLTASYDDRTSVAPFVSEQYYLLANYSEREAASPTRHYLTGTAANSTPYLSATVAPERLFQITYNPDHGTYGLKNMTLDHMLTSPATSSNYESDPSAVAYGDMTNTSQSEFVITPYQDGANTYFTIRPHNVDDGVASSLAPQHGGLVEGATLRLVNSKSSRHLQGSGSSATYSTFAEDYYRTARWQLVVPTLLPPVIAMDNQGHVTLTDVRPYIAGTLKYQVKANGSDTWSSEADYSQSSAITLAEGDELRVWKENSDQPMSQVRTFTAVKVATPTAERGAGNMVTLGTTTPDATLYYSMGSEAPTTHPATDGSALYGGPFALNHAGVVACRAYADNMLMSDVLEYHHTAVLPLQITAEGGYATLGMSDVSVTSGYTIYYTTDGSNPSSASTLYDNSPIDLTGVMVLKAQAYPLEDNNGYESSPVEYYYTSNQMLTFCYLDQDRVEGHTPVAADTNMMLLAATTNSVRNDHNIDGTFLWRCSNGASKLYNEATASYLTFTTDGGLQLFGTTDITLAKEWQWSGEPSADNESAEGKYRLSTTVDGTTYYLAFDKTADAWTVTAEPTNANLELAVAYRTDLVAYPGGQEFSAHGANLYLEMADGSRVELDGTNQPWLALSQGESATLRASLRGTLLTYVANIDINIHKYGLDDQVHQETDYNNYVPWQQWHQLNDNYYHYYYDVPGYTSEPVDDGVEYTNIMWRYNQNDLVASGTLDGTYFTYAIDAENANVITVSRTNTAANAPVLNLTPLTINYHHSSSYANGGVEYNETLSLGLYAESKVTSGIGDVTLGKRLSNKQTQQYLTADPVQTVAADVAHPYLSGEPVVGTDLQYTKYAVWQFGSLSGNQYSLSNMVYARGAYYRADDFEGGLYLCNPQSNAMFNYTHAEHTNPLTDGRMKGGFSLTKYANGTGEYYVTLAQGTRKAYGLDAAGSWQTVAYGNGGENGFWSRRWKWEDAPLTPPDISMNPSGVVTLSHLQAGTNGLEYRYTTDGSVPTASSTLWTATTTVTLAENDMFKAVAVLSGVTSEVNSFKALRCETPTMEGTTLTATEGDSLVMGVNQALGSVHWNMEESEGIVRYDQSSVRSSEYETYFRNGDVMEVVAYRHNKLESQPFYYTQQQQLHLAVTNVTVGEVGTDNTYSATITFSVTGSAQNGQNPQPQSYQIPYSFAGVDNAAVSGSGTWNGSDELVYTLTGLSGAVMLTAHVEPRADFSDFYTASEPLSQYIVPAGYTQTLAQDANNVYLINNALDLVTVANTPTMWSGSFKVMNDIDLTGINLPSIGGNYIDKSNVNQTNSFVGRWDGNYMVISHATNPLFKQCSNAHVYNVIIANSDITDTGLCGAITAVAFKNTRIYNCGVRGESTVLGSKATGGLVGRMYDNGRVVNCYNFASVTSTGGNAGGIVGMAALNSTTTSQTSIVFNCVNYGNVTTVGIVAPILSGDKYTSAFNTYNYFKLDIELTGREGQEDAYNCALPIEERFLTRFEFYRTVLNANLKKAGWWVDGTFREENSGGATMGKWVIDKSIAPYPVVLPKYSETETESYSYVDANSTTITVTQPKAIRYPSVINPDYENSARRDTLQPYQGKKLGELGITVNSGSPNNAILASGASFPTLTSLATAPSTLNITDMDTTAYDYNYYKVQLPYFQDIYGLGSNVQTVDGQDYIVTGWDITSVTGDPNITYHTYVASDYDFADRYCIEKDLYARSGRVFAQGGYYNVPEGVTAITISAHWGKAIYLAETANEAYYSGSYTVNPANFYGTLGTTLYGKEKTVCHTKAEVKNLLSNVPTVYDQAIVLLSDFHYCYQSNAGSAPGQEFFNFADDKTYYPFTITTTDADNDHEPDHGFFQSYKQRQGINPVRYDFIANMGMSVAGIVAKKLYTTSIAIPSGHFEITETALAYYGQFEYDNNESNNTNNNIYDGKPKQAGSALILNNGAFDQIVSSQKNIADRTAYIHLGGHTWFKMFSPGLHGDGKNYNGGRNYTKHCPVTVTGGEYEEFYLSGMFLADAAVHADDPHFYANGGRFGQYASGGQEKIDGNVVVVADHIIADEFYGGGINPAKAITGNVSVTLNNSIIGLYAGGPKFGNMATGKTVTTSAIGTTFSTYYGAGYGGTGLNLWRHYNLSSGTPDWPTQMAKYVKGRYYTTNAMGIDVDYKFEYIPLSGGYGNHVSRFYAYRAILSPATTNNVTSTLTNCTVLNDYYGAGYVGAVNGIATSVLDDCTIHGNVYAGGNSSEVPKALLYDPVTVWPSFNNKTGVYTLPTKPTPEEYTWTYKSSGYTANSTQIDVDNKLIYTNVSLDIMGQANETELTIMGNTVVMGSVFGGGNLAEVAGNTLLTIGEASIATGEDIANHRPYIYHNVYGGGNVADVGTNTGLSTTTVNVYQGYMRSVYGGGNQGSIGGNTVVNLKGGFVGYRPAQTEIENTYPGSSSHPSQEGTAEPIRPAIGRDKMFFGVYGGGYGIGTTVAGTATVNVGDETEMTDDIKVFGSVYGGGEAGQVGGGYQMVTLKEGETLTNNYYYFDGSQYVRCTAGEARAEGMDYYKFVPIQSSYAATSQTTSVSVVSDGTRSTEIGGAVYGGGRGYYVALENDTVAMGSEVTFTRPTAGAVYGNTKVEIGTEGTTTTETDMFAATEKLTIGSVQFFTELEKAKEYGLIDQDSITSSPMGYWRQNLYVYDVDKLRYVPLTTGENTAIDCNAATPTGSKTINTSAETLDEEVLYYMPTGRVAVAGGGEKGRVFGSKAFNVNNILFGNTGSDMYNATGGCTEVVIHSGRMGDMNETDRLVHGDVYGAGLQADIDGTSSVYIDGTSMTTWIRGDVYAGGCMGTNHAYNRQNEDENIDVTTATVTGGWLRNLHAASNLVELPKNGNSRMVFGTVGGDNGDLLVSESIYGGSGLSYMQGTTDVTMNSGYVGFIRPGYRINSENEKLPLTIGSTEPIIANVDSVLSYEGNVYGGGYGPNAYVKRTKVTVNGGVVRNGVFGGGELAPVGEIVGTDPSQEGTATYEYLTYDEHGNDMVVPTYYIAPTVEEGSQATMGFATDVVINGGTMSGVYGGGRGYSRFLNVASTMPGTIMGSASVRIVGGTVDSSNYQSALGGGNVYGGGLEGEVTGDTRVEIAGGTIVGRVFAGGRGYRNDMLQMLDVDENIFDRASRRAGWVLGNTSLTVTDGNIAYGVYGGGEGLKYKTRVSGGDKWDVVAVVDGNATVNITGGTIGGGYQKGNDPERGSYAGGRVASVNGYADMLVSGTANVASVYGGNDISGGVECTNGRNTINNAGETLIVDSTYTYVRVTETPQIGHVFGGGNGQYPYYNDVAYTSRLYLEKPVQTKTYVDLNTTGGYIGEVFGGGNSASVGTEQVQGTAQVFYRGTGHVDTIFAGGNSATVTGAATVTVRAADLTPANGTEHVSYLFGGNNMETMKILPTLNLTKGVLGNVYGGGNAGAMMGIGSREDVFGNTVVDLSTYVLVNSEYVTVTGSLFGGCNNAAVGGSTYVDVRKTSDQGINMLFGGNDISEYVSNARLDVSGGTIGKMFGGSNGYYDYRRNGNSWDVYDKVESIEPSGEGVAPSNSSQNVQTPVSAPTEGSDAVAINTVGSPTVGATLVNVWGGTINNNIYGGGYAGDCGTTHVVVNDTANWDAENASNDPLGRTEGGKATINGKIFGGGYGDIALLGTATPHVGNVTECATTDLYNVANLRDAYAYGGGEAGDVQDAVINVHEGWNQPLTALYGGCYGSDVKGTATVNMYCDAPASGYNVTTLYGGNDYTGTVNRSVVNVYAGRYDRLFGAGNGKYTYSGGITPPNSQYPTVNFYDGTVTGNLYGGGEQGMCFVGTPTDVSSRVDDYAHVVVNIHGGYFAKDIFTGAAGNESHPEQLIYGLKQLNMDGGEVHNSVYGGSESVTDGYPSECIDENNTTLRPSSILNITGGTIHNNVYGGGYLGQVHGSVYVNVGEDAVLNSPVWTNTIGSTANAYQTYKPAFVTDEAADTGSNLMKRSLELGASVYNGANWGEAGSAVFFNTRGFFGGESRIYVDGNGYNTSGSVEGSSMPEMDIYYSLIGAGTSCEGGDVERHILVRNYGERNGCETSKTLFSIQRADTVRLQNTAIKLIGDQDALSAYPSSRYSVNRVKCLRLQDYNVLEIDEPIARTGRLQFITSAGATDTALVLRSNNTEALSAMRSGVASVICSTATVCERLNAAVDPATRLYSTILANNGVSVDIVNEEGTLGAVEGYGFLLSQDGYRTIVTARSKTGTKNPNDGGFFSCCNENTYTQNGAYHDGNAGEFSFVNNIEGDNSTYRTWKSDDEITSHTTRKVTIVAHSNVNKLDNNRAFASSDIQDVMFGLAKGTIELPSTSAGHYYTIEDGVHNQGNSDLILLTGAFKPNDFTAETVEGTWYTLTPETNITTVQTDINGDPSHKFGLLMTSGGNFDENDPNHSTTAVISTNTVYSMTENAYRTTSVTAPNGENEVIPKLDFYLTYSTEFATTTFGEVTFILTERDENGSLVGKVDVSVSLTTVIEEFRNQSYDMVAMHNDIGNNQYTRKMVLPASMQRRNLYLTSVQWAPCTTSVHIDGKLREGTGIGHPAAGVSAPDTTKFYLTDMNHTSLMSDGFTFALKMSPTEYLSQSMSTTLGWYSIEDHELDIFADANRSGDSAAYSSSNASDRRIAMSDADLAALDALRSPDNTNPPDPTADFNRGHFVGVLDGRSAAAIDISLIFDGETESIYLPQDGCRGIAVLGFDYWNGDTWQGHFDVTVYIRTRSQGDTIYLASAKHITRNGKTIDACNDESRDLIGLRPDRYVQTLEYALYNLYQAGDVLCILDELDITGNQSLHGLDYSYIPVVRYEGHHIDFPGRECAYQGTMIKVKPGANLTTDNIVFDGSMVSRYLTGGADNNYTTSVDNQWPTGTLTSTGPIFEVENGGTLNLGNNTVLQNNFNTYDPNASQTYTYNEYYDELVDYRTQTSPQTGGAVHVSSGGLLKMENNVTIKNNLEATGVSSGAVHVDGGTLLLGTAKDGTSIHVEENYLLPAATDIVDAATHKLSLPEELARANVYLTRTGVDNSEIADAQSDVILFESELAADTRIGITKDFPGATSRDTIRIAQVSGSHPQYAQRAYTNENFFNDGTDGKVFFNSTISTKTIYFQRCATFSKQRYGETLNYIVQQNGTPQLLTDGTQLPVLTYQWNQFAACPDETDSLVYQVHGGFYPYTYRWEWGSSANNLSSYREYTTPYTNDAVNADLANRDFAKATASNRDAGELHGMLLDGGMGGDFYYRVTATDLAGCQLTKNVKVTMMHHNEDASITLDGQTHDLDENEYTWCDTANVSATHETIIHEATRNFRGIHLVKHVVPDPSWGNVDGYMGQTEVTLTDDEYGTLLCPGDAIQLNATAVGNHNFIQWDFDPYDRDNTVFVMPHSVTDVHINAYFGPNDYWKNVVRSKPESVEYDYNGDVHIYDADGLAWLISLTNGLNGQQIRDFYFNTVYIHNPNASTTDGDNSKEGESTAETFNYDMSAHLWTPMSGSQHPFMGKLRVDDGVTISGIIVNEPRMDHAGFFAYLDSADIDGLHLQKSLFHGSQYVGGIAAEALASTIANSSVADTGVVGENPDITTLITANYASGGLVGTATGSTFSGCSAAAKYMGATIYNGGILGIGQEVDVTNNFVWSQPRMSSLYSSGIVGSITGPAVDSKSRGSRIANNYVHFVGSDTPLNRVGGLVGFARNTTLENNYVYGSTQGGVLTGAIGAVLDRGVTVRNCYYEQGSNEAAFGYSGTDNHTEGITTFNGTGNQVMMADRVDGSNNLTLALNRWVRDYGGEGFATWRSDLEGTNHGYPRFGKPDLVPIYEHISYETCDSLTFADATLTESGVYEFHTIDSADFVDSTVLLTLTVHYSSLTQFEDTVLLGEDYEAHGFHLSATEIALLREAAQEGEIVTVVVSDTLQSLHSCDSIVTLYLTVGKGGTDQPPVVLDVKVYPNPTVGQITVEADEMQLIELYDGVSRRIDRRTVESGSSTLDLSNLPTGIYYLRVKTANGTVIKKIIKQ
jgi:hypothetical protein